MANLYIYLSAVAFLCNILVFGNARATSESRSTFCMTCKCQKGIYILKINAIFLLHEIIEHVLFDCK